MKSSPNVRIGFHDQWLMLYMIPTLAFVIPIAFFGIRFHEPAGYIWEIYWHTLLITAVLWLGNRFVMIWARNKFPDFLFVRKRIIVQSIIMLVYTILVTNTIGIFLKTICSYSTAELSGHSISDMIISSNSASIFCTLTITAIYESRYFMSELKRSVEEKELSYNR